LRERRGFVRCNFASYFRDGTLASRPIAALIALALAACATPSQRYANDAAELGFERTTLAGDGFRHVAYFTGLGERADALHVYVEHDGSPWLERTLVAADPTPREPLALALMARDRGPRLLLGRPCYFETRTDAGCSPLLWTHRRYAPEVVASMAAALRGFLAEHPFAHVVLIGYSGGGTLAWLIAARLAQASAVVTIAANLDTDAWARLHAYTPLAGSLNPALQPPLPSSVRELHFAGGRDANVPPSIAASFRARHPQARVVELESFDHSCCWVERWPRLLDDAMMAASDAAAAATPHR
jgi:dienelactone hydrolase